MPGLHPPFAGYFAVNSGKIVYISHLFRFPLQHAAIPDGRAGSAWPPALRAPH